MPFYPVGPSVFLFLNAKKTKTSANWWQRSKENDIICKISDWAEQLSYSLRCDAEKSISFVFFKCFKNS